MKKIIINEVLLYSDKLLVKNPLRLCIAARDKIFSLIVIVYLMGSSLPAQESFTIQLGKDAMVLLDETEFTITGKNSADYHHKLIVQINNANGKEYSEDVYYETEYHKVTDIEAVIKDLNGEIIRELDQDDIHHSSITQEIDDAITYWFNLYSPKYPYIFERTIEYEYSTLLFWPPWQPERDIPVLKSIYRIRNDASVEFKTLPIGIEIQPEISVNGSDSIYTWEMEYIPAKNSKYRTPPEHKVEKKILFASKYFKVDEYAGSSESWEDFATWERRLFQGKYNLSPEAIAEVRKITATATNDHEKIQLIYSYLQENTRYVAIELGIGGWQPYSADWVYNKKYGDCKDLSTCMIAMLDAVDIKAYPALMKTRDKGIVYTDFPSNQFNHVFVFIPLEKDTVWIEATADYLKAGELNYSREGCHVLVVKDDGSEILTTPLSKSSDNLEITRLEGVINSLSKFKFDGQITYTGNDKFRMDYHHKTKDKLEMEKYIHTYLGRFEATPEVGDYQFKNSNEHISLSVSGEYKNVANQTRQRIFLNPNILNRIDFDEDLKDEVRTIPVYYSYPFIEIDTIIMKIPVAKDIEAAPEKLNIDNNFAKYKTDYTFSDKTLTYIRHYEIKSRLISAEDYPAYVDLMLSIEQNDRRKFVFLKY